MPSSSSSSSFNAAEHGALSSDLVVVSAESGINEQPNAATTASLRTSSLHPALSSTHGYMDKATSTVGVQTRPGMLSLSSTLGKARSTSSTSVTTIPRIQRSSSNRSIAASRASPLTKGRTATQKELNIRSVPASPTARLSSREPNDRLSQSDNEGGQSRSAHDPFHTMTDSQEGSIGGPEEVVEQSGMVEATTETSGEDSGDEDQEEVAWPLEHEVDPRVLLREQLRRTESSRLPRSRAESYRSSKSVSYSLASVASPVTEPAHEGRTYQDNTHANALKSTESAASRAESQEPRRYFVLTSAGKPVFASQPDWRKRRNARTFSSDAADKGNGEHEAEEMLTSLVGVVQAIISLYAVENDMIKCIDAGELRIAFYLKAPLYFVAVSHWQEPESVLRLHLEYLYLAIISITTTSTISSIFKQRSSYDLRRLLTGTDGILNNLLQDLQETATSGHALFEATTAALTVVPFLPIIGRSSPDAETSSHAIHVNVETLRDECTKALRPPKKYNDILYALLVSGTSLITLLRPKGHSIYPADLHILLNTINSTEALQVPKSESWIPICLPRFNSRGFLHAFISYLQDGESMEGSAGSCSNIPDPLRLGVILVTADKEGFFDMKNWKDVIANRLLQTASGIDGMLASLHPPKEGSLYQRLRSAMAPGTPTASVHSMQSSSESFASPSRIDTRQFQPNIAPIRHFWYKSKTYVQLFTPSQVSGGGEIDIKDKNCYPSPYDTCEVDRRRLVTLYLNTREALPAPANRSRGDGPARLVYLGTEHEAVLGLTTTHYELYICLPPLVPKKTATDAAHALARWVRKNERLIFLTSAPSL